MPFEQAKCSVPWRNSLILFVISKVQVNTLALFSQLWKFYVYSLFFIQHAEKIHVQMTMISLFKNFSVFLSWISIRKHIAYSAFPPPRPMNKTLYAQTFFLNCKYENTQDNTQDNAMCLSPRTNTFWHFVIFSSVFIL